MQNHFELEFREKDFKEVFFGESFVKLYFTRTRMQTVKAVLISLLLLGFTIYIAQINSVFIGFVIITSVITILFIIRLVCQFYTFQKWQNEVYEFIDRNRIFANALVELEQLYLILSSKGGNKKTILAYAEIIVVDIDEQRTIVNDGKENGFIFPQKSFQSERAYNDFCDILGNRIQKFELK